MTAHSLVAGNVHQLFGRHSEEWMRALVDTYGPLSKLTGPFSVRTPIFSTLPRS